MNSIIQSDFFISYPLSALCKVSLNTIEYRINSISHNSQWLHAKNIWDVLILPRPSLLCCFLSRAPPTGSTTALIFCWIRSARWFWTDKVVPSFLFGSQYYNWTLLLPQVIHFEVPCVIVKTFLYAKCPPTHAHTTLWIFSLLFYLIFWLLYWNYWVPGLLSAKCCIGLNNY